MASTVLRPVVGSRTSGNTADNPRNSSPGTTRQRLAGRGAARRDPPNVNGRPRGRFEAAPPGHARRRGGLDPTASPFAVPRHVSADPTRTRTRPASGRATPSVVQALHLMNAPSLHQKITNDAGRAAKLARRAKEVAPERGRSRELYLLTYGRLPRRNEERGRIREGLIPRAEVRPQSGPSKT